MNRKNYDTDTLRILDIVGTYFIDVFYNEIYIKSTEIFNKGKAKSCTDAYRMLVRGYVNGVSTRKDLYMATVKKIHEYYINTQGMPCVFAEFEDDFLSKFIPREYYSILNSQEKDKILHEILIAGVTQLGNQLLQQNNLQKIIDNHRARSNIALFQENMVDIFLIQREIYYQKFTKEIVNESAKVPLEIYNKLKFALKEEIARRTKLEKDHEIALNIIKELMVRLKEACAGGSTVSKIPEMGQKESNNGPSVASVPKLEHKQVPEPQAPPKTHHTPAPAPIPPRTAEKIIPGAPRKLPQTRYPSPERDPLPPTSPYQAPPKQESRDSEESYYSQSDESSTDSAPVTPFKSNNRSSLEHSGAEEVEPITTPLDLNDDDPWAAMED